MKAFTEHTGIVVPIDRPNIDTDAIIPKQFLKSIKRSGFGVNLFDEWRYTDVGEPGKPCDSRPLNPDFALNQVRYKGASILLARDNFGCGSSREHAVWALEDYGIRTVIAPSYSDIFFNNCFKNGVLPICLSSEQVDALFVQTLANAGFTLTIDLHQQVVMTESGDRLPFEIDAFRKHCLMNGLDDIGLTLQHADAIKSYEQQRASLTPWLFDERATR